MAGSNNSNEIYIMDENGDVEVNNNELEKYSSFLKLNKYPSFEKCSEVETNAIQTKLRDIFIRGIQESWMIPFEELRLGSVFNNGANSMIYECTWRGINIVCKKPIRYKLNLLIDLLREIEIWSTLRHPNVVQFLGISVDPETNELYMMLERVEGCTLYDYIQQNKTRLYDMNQCHDLVCMVLFLHSCTTKIMFRDLKPQNIMVDKYSKRLKLIDFGLSRYFAENEPYQLTGETGTLRYMPPEVFRNESYNLTVDVYSMGLIMYFILTKDIPFAHFNSEKMHQFLSNSDEMNLALLDKKYPTMTAIVRKCICKDSTRRASIGEVHQLLENHIEKKSPKRCVIA